MECMQLFLFSLPALLLFFLILNSRQAKKKRWPAKGRKAHCLLGSLPDFIRNRHRFIEWTTESLIESSTHTITFTIPGVGGRVVTANTNNVEHMLKNKFENYPKGERTIFTLRDLLGHGIFNSDGDHWRSQRKTASFEFNKRSLRNFVMGTVDEEISERLLPLLSHASEVNEVLDLQDVLARFAFDNICKVAFGEDPCSLSDMLNSSPSSSSTFAQAFDDASFFIIDRLLEPLPLIWKMKRLLKVGSERRLKESISIVEDYAMKIIRSRKNADSKSLHSHEDLLSRFSANEDNTEEFLRDIVISFMAAGRETTSSALVWFFWILSSRLDVEKKILQEVRSVRRTTTCNSKTCTFTFDERREMHYLHAAISESLRLYPPVPLDTQSCKDGDVMPDGTFVGEGWTVSYCAYAMGRMKDIWGEDCEEYRPERWLHDNGEFRPENPFKFPVFHAGPRMCLGKEMAYIQMKSIVACMLERFEVDVMVDKHVPPEHLLSMTLKMKNGLPIRVRKRDAIPF